jgi:hypothetical protein
MVKDHREHRNGLANGLLAKATFGELGHEVSDLLRRELRAGEAG